MEIWEEPYIDKKYGKETRASFKIFQQLLKQGYPYNRRELARNLVSKSRKKAENEQNIEKRIQRKYSTISGYSVKYKWQKRLNAYEKHLQEVEREEIERKLGEWKNKELDNAMLRVSYHNARLQQIHNNTRMKEKEKAIAEEKNENAYAKSVERVFQIAHGGVIRTESKSEVKSDIKVNEYGVLGELFTEEELEEMKEDLTDDSDEPLDDDFSEFE